MSHSLPELGYAYDALEPYIDAKTMEIHHTRHHQTYVDKLNGAITGHKALESLDVNTLISDLEKVPEEIRAAVRNHGGGHSNHSFFWPLLKKNVPAQGPVMEAIEKDFGSFNAFKDIFSTRAALLFGSGWAWVVSEKGRLSILTTPNQDSPVSQGKAPILGIDVWEHAYYLNYQNRRPYFIGAWWNVVNWKKVSDLYQAA